MSMIAPRAPTNIHLCGNKNEMLTLCNIGLIMPLKMKYITKKVDQKILLRFGIKSGLFTSHVSPETI